MKKYWTYISERFPLQSHVPIIAVFTYSAICYSLSSVQATHFVSWDKYLAALALTLSIFFLLRIADEWKDQEDDRRYRAYLPVPRGLVTLAQLRNVAWVVLAFQALVLFLYPAFLPIYAIAMLYMGLMYQEFFLRDWLKARPMVYVFSHMAIIPLVDLVASAAHWAHEGRQPPLPLAWFFAVSFFNGIVLEFGRKIKAPEREEKGVQSYTFLYGTRGGVGRWMLLLTLTLLWAGAAAAAVQHPSWVYVALGIIYIMCLLPAIAFWRKPTPALSKAIEICAGLWTLGMYLLIGVLPFLLAK